MSSETSKIQAPTASKTVTVGCKLPHGLLLRLFEMAEKTVDVIGGGQRVVKEAINAHAVDKVVKINGYAVPHGMRSDVAVVGGDTGFALTLGVDREFFEHWLDQNKDTDMVRKGFIFAAGGEQSARDSAKEKKALKNGMEPLDPNNLPRVGKMKIKKYDPKDDRVEAA